MLHRKFLINIYLIMNFFCCDRFDDKKCDVFYRMYKKQKKYELKSKSFGKMRDDMCKMWRNITRNNCVRIFLHKIHVSGHVASFLFAPLQIRSLAQNCDENYTTNDIRTLLQFDVLIIMISVYSSRIRFDIRGQFQHKRDVVHMNHRQKSDTINESRRQRIFTFFFENIRIYSV